jgi:hypothetical protein
MSSFDNLCRLFREIREFLGVFGREKLVEFASCQARDHENEDQEPDVKGLGKNGIKIHFVTTVYAKMKAVDEARSGILVK